MSGGTTPRTSPRRCTGVLGLFLRGRVTNPERHCIFCRIASALKQLDGSQRDQDAFFGWINEKVLPELRCFARENRFHEWSDLVTIHSENGDFMCQATPKSSGGEYLYIGCWEVEQKSSVTDNSADDTEES